MQWRRDEKAKKKPRSRPGPFCSGRSLEGHCTRDAAKHIRVGCSVGERIVIDVIGVSHSQAQRSSDRDLLRCANCNTPVEEPGVSTAAVQNSVVFTGIADSCSDRSCCAFCNFATPDGNAQVCVLVSGLTFSKINLTLTLELPLGLNLGYIEYWFPGGADSARKVSQLRSGRDSSARADCILRCQRRS